MFGRLYEGRKHLQPHSATNELVLLAGLYGLAALPATAKDLVAPLHPTTCLRLGLGVAVAGAAVEAAGDPAAAVVAADAEAAADNERSYYTLRFRACGIQGLRSARAPR